MTSGAGTGTQASTPALIPCFLPVKHFSAQ